MGSYGSELWVHNTQVGTEMMTEVSEGMKLEGDKVYARKVADKLTVGTLSPQVKRDSGNGEVVVNAARVRDLLNSITPEAAGENTVEMVPPYPQTQVQLGQKWGVNGTQMGTAVEAGGAIGDTRREQCKEYDTSGAQDGAGERGWEGGK